MSDIKLSAGRLKGRGIAISGILVGVLGCLFTIALVLPATRSAREGARRAQCINNLKQIGFALEAYHLTYGSFPPAAITDKVGKPLLSWRVAILAELESSSELYAKFHLDEPWDSPHNLTLLDKMPWTYACPSDSTLQHGLTGYRVVAGPNAVFKPNFKPLRFADITDGLGNTLIVGESRRTIPWTKPDDLPFVTTEKLHGLGSHHGYHNNGFNVLYADGSVRFLSSEIDPKVIDSLLTPNGQDGVFNLDL